MADFFESNTSIQLNVEQFNKLHGLQLTQFTFSQLIQSIKSGCKKLGINIKSRLNQCNPKQSYIESLIARQKKGCGKYYKILMCKNYQEFNTSDKNENSTKN